MGDHTHLELLTRVDPVLTFLAKNDAITNEKLDLLWNATQGDQHETLVHQMWEIISKLVSHLPSSKIYYIFNLLLKLPKKDYDYQFIQTIHRISNVGIQAMLKEEVTPRVWYGMEVFWNILQDGSDYPSTAIQATFHPFQQLITAKHCQLLRIPYLEQCIENLQNGRSVPQTLRLARDIICMSIHVSASPLIFLYSFASPAMNFSDVLTC